MTPSTILPAMMIAAACSTTLLLAGCGSSSHEPREVQANNPTVTYRYHGDQELLAANQNANAFCSQYKAVPRTQRFTDTSEGHAVVFECVPTATVSTVEFAPDTPYAYRTDQELLDRSSGAERYCRAHGGTDAVSSITANPDGTRTVTYKCVLR